MTIADVRRKLTPGTIFTGEFVGANARICVLGLEKTTRVVDTCTSHQLVSKFLDGPKVGQPIHLTWSGLKARDEDGSIILSDDGNRGDFLKITLAPKGGSDA